MSTTTHNRFVILGAGVSCLAALLSLPAPAQEAAQSSDALAPFERLVGGEWHMDDSYQVFEWGVGKRSVTGKSYFVVEGKDVLVSEGSWFWHPGEQEIKGYFTAVNMPVDFFDYTTRFEDGDMINDLVGYGEMGGDYHERWEFTDDRHFKWTLLGKSDSGLVEVMSGVYERR
jgi:hypothetical protein